MSKIKSMARVTLLLQPWLTYSQVRNKIETHVGKVATGTVGVYGSEIRPEIGCTLTTRSGREVLRVDLERYEAACEKYGVVGADKAELLAAATPNRNVIVISPKVFLGELEPASPAVIEAAQTIVDQIKSAASVKLSKMRKGDLSGLHTAPAELDELNRATPEVMQAAFQIVLDRELNGHRLNDAVIREDFTAKVEAAELRSTEARDRLKLLETQLSAAKQEADEAAQALQILDDLASAPMSVIRAILG